MRLNLSNRGGFALPTAIMMSVVIAAALAAGFVAVTGEMNTNIATRGQNRAYNIAESGLEQFMVNRNVSGWCQHCGDPITADSEWTRVSLTGGYADVVAVKLRPALDSTTPAVYFIRSTGVDTSLKLSGAGNSVYAQHTVGVYAKWTTTTMKVTAAWVSLSGLVKNGAGTIDGTDNCGLAPAVAGAQVDKGDFVNNGNASVFGGSPPVDTSQTFAQMKASSTIDWNAIINQNAIAADRTIPGNAFPNAEFADTNYWPVIRIHTNGYGLPNKGRGIIIADSDFTISGTNMWSGIIMVGGQLTSNGNNTTFGATLSGLNFLIGGTPSPSTVDDATANGQKTYIYDSCSVSKASASLRKYIAIPNSWSDNIAAW